MSNWSNTRLNCSEALQLRDENQQSCHDDDQYGILQLNSRQGSDFWNSRRAFLSSYHFSDQQRAGFKERLRKSVKEINGAAVAVVSDIRQQVASRRFGIRVFRLTMALPSLVHVSVRCFTPWLNKKDFVARGCDQ
ncbi:hypothetical protein TorRG33x02_008240 [Trema orientale]|uniref:Uncharacterized protein n=1 Tax=Trema orientale TaxID=63057 RepID=A0A2P5G0S8_TREOI|nr:hypothetical protein TorRG33x02_008240 [Trema orientale]